MKKNFRVKAVVMVMALMLVFTVMPMFAKADAQVINCSNLSACSQTLCKQTPCSIVQGLNGKSCNINGIDLSAMLQKLGSKSGKCVGQCYYCPTQKAATNCQGLKCLTGSNCGVVKNCTGLTSNTCKSVNNICQ